MQDGVWSYSPGHRNCCGASFQLSARDIRKRRISARDVCDDIGLMDNPTSPSVQHFVHEFGAINAASGANSIEYVDDAARALAAQFDETGISVGRHESGALLGSYWLRQIALASLDRQEHVNERLNRLDAWVVAAVVDELSNEAKVHSCRYRDGFIARGACLAQLAPQVFDDRFHAVSVPYGVQYAIPFAERKPPDNHGVEKPEDEPEISFPVLALNARALFERQPYGIGKLAKVIGIGNSALQRILAGTSVELKTLSSFAKHFKTTPAKLLEFDRSAIKFRDLDPFEAQLIGLYRDVTDPDLQHVLLARFNTAVVNAGYGNKSSQPYPSAAKSPARGGAKGISVFGELVEDEKPKQGKAGKK